MPQKSHPVTLLGIETSCDETAVSIVQAKGTDITILANIVSSQVQLHAHYGGVVPNLAAREHTKNILPVLQEALETANLTQEHIDAIAVTKGPGLIPALLVGTTVARTLSYLWKKPLLGIHHIEGHIYANFISEVKSQKSKAKSSESSLLSPVFPLLALVVSGGHTQLILMKKHFDYEIIGETQDDAVGEAFDKVARILNLGYPGGPAVSSAAEQATLQEQGRLKKPSSLTPTLIPSVILPRPMLHSPNYNFSFSGLKTAVLYAVQKFRKENSLTENDPLPHDFINTLCFEFQQASIDVLIAKTIKAAKKYTVKHIIIAGGVSANTELRKQLGEAISTALPSVRYSLPPIHLSVDNAAMIASAGSFRWNNLTQKEKEMHTENWKTLQTYSDLSLS